jgi:hypothetical protein
MVKKDDIKESWMDILKYLAKKKTIAFLVFIVIIILATRTDFSCGRKNNEWEFYLQIKNLDQKIPDRR